MTWMELVKEYFPEITDEEAEGLLWERTGFPCFWSDSDGDTPETCCRKQLQELKEIKSVRN